MRDRAGLQFFLRFVSANLPTSFPMDVSVAEPVIPRFAVPSIRRHLAHVFAIEGLGSVGGNLLMFAIFFYMQKRFGWGARSNLLLASAQGGAYIIGALSINPLSRRFERRTLLLFLHGLMAASAFAGAVSPSPVLIVIYVLAYPMFGGAQWPLMESLIAFKASPAEMSRRISVYNLVWSGTGAITIALCGIVLAHFPPGIFLAAGGVHLLAVILLLQFHPPAHPAPAPHLHAAPELLRLRTLAMQLSRIALPATFAVIYSLGALMPSLPVIRSAAPELRTLLASVWMISRWFCFLLLGATAWWHTRPRTLLFAAMVLLAAFLSVTLIPSTASMVLWQIALGAAMGLIYSASLYFGMVLSDGSTAQNAYHEALIGLGCVLGPGCGAMAQICLPNNPHASVAAVGTILWLSVLAAVVISLRSRPMAGGMSGKAN
jgi:MFS family permease